MFKSSVTCSCRSPLPETETLFIFQRPLTWRLQLSAIVKLSSLIWTGADLQNQGLLRWSTGIRTQNDRTKICSVTVTPCFNKTSTELFGWWSITPFCSSESNPYTIYYWERTLIRQKFFVSLVSICDQLVDLLSTHGFYFFNKQLYVHYNMLIKHCFYASVQTTGANCTADVVSQN